MNSQLLGEDGWPRSRETAALVRRMSAIDWFRRVDRSQAPAARLAAALEEHARRLPLDPPIRDVAVLTPWEGRTALRNQSLATQRARWEAALRAPFDRVRTAVVQTGRAAGHAMLVISGDALLMRPQALPIDQEDLWTRLEGPADDRLPDAVVRRLVDRVLWEAGMMVAWEMVADLLGDNPFAPLLTVYEEGLYPLDVRDGGAVLWAPE